MRASFFTLTIIFLFFSMQAFGQSVRSLAKKYLEDTREQYNLGEDDLADWIVTDEYIGRNSGVQHIYLRQRYQGIEVYSADAGVHLLPGGALLTMNNQFFADLASRITGPVTPALSAVEAIRAASTEMGYPLIGEFSILKNIGGTAREMVISGESVSDEPIPVKLVYQPNEEGQLLLAWDMSIYEPNHQNWWSMRVNAASGRIMDKLNWVVSCNFDHPATGATTHICKDENKVNRDWKSMGASSMMSGTYRVFAEPVESPSHGSRTLVADPANPTASPFGWHDTDGATGAEFTYTRGNNVWAQEDRNGNNGTGYSPDGGTNLIFDFPLDLALPPIDNEDNNITNLFYWNNLIHDVLYIYGFDEAAGNFQENNYGRGGLGSDHVWGDAQDGSGSNNANFGTPPDGSNPRMQMFLWTAPNPDIDGDLDNGVIVHEYGHGISNRLTGGGSNTGCLSNREQMGEGWSDWYGLMFTMQATDVGTDSRGIGTYVLDQPPTGGGIRVFPYTTDMGVNPDTYDVIKSTSSVHRTGSVWCAMIWELTWALIDQYGFDPDLYYGTGGNNVAMQLVTEGMALQPCRPGFVEGRDAILAADVALYGGANSCEIWNAFAKRGLGYSADQGSSNSRTDGTEAFDLPPSTPNPCSSAPDFLVGLNPIRSTACPGDTIEFTVSVLSANGFNTGVDLTATSLPGSAVATFTPATVIPPATAIMQITNTSGVADGTYTVSATGSDNSISQTGSASLTIISGFLSPPALVSPADGSTTEISATQYFSWNSVSGATSYDIQIASDAAFNTIVESGAEVDALDYTSQLLSQNVTYYWRVRTNTTCGGGNWSAAQSFSIHTCGGTFVDSGGPNNDHGNQENFTWVFCPDVPGEFVRVDFTVFDLEERPSGGCYDYLEVFDGDNINAPLLGQFCDTGLSNAPGGGTIFGDNNPGGCLTFVFYSDQNVTEEGWEATISCVTCISPTVNNAQITNATCDWSEDGSMLISGSSSNPIEFLLTPLGGGTTRISATGQFNQLSPQAYSVQAREVGNPSCISPATNFVVGAENSGFSVIHVDQDAMGSNNGVDWANAYNDLQDALNAASLCDQVWVRAQTNLPFQENPFTTATGPRDQSFYIDEFIGVFGGFNGSENELTQRNSYQNKTILSGDLGNPESLDDNAWHVVWIEGTSCVIDGFYITLGNADDVNEPNDLGGGIYINGQTSAANPIVKNCFVIANFADYGGGMYCAGNGSGSESSPRIINTLFSGNLANQSGGGLFNNGSAGGSSTPAVINSNFVRNSAVSGMGAGMYNESADTEISNSIFWDNMGSGMSMHNSSSSPVINYSLLAEGSCPAGAVCDAATLGLLGQDPQFKDADGPDNNYGTTDDDLRLTPVSPAIEAGTWVDSPTDDFAGRRRAQGIAIDLGIFESPAARMSLQLYLEGPFDNMTGLMRTDLMSAGLLPTTEPFTGLGFVHSGGGGGESSSQTVFTDYEIVDWVFVELRDKNDYNSVLASRSALLRNNGEIVDLDGFSPLAFFDKEEDDYYVSIRQMNHIGVVSANVLSLSNSETTYDFSSNPANSLGGLLSLIDLNGSIYGLAAGDFDSNGQIQNTDQNNIIPLIGISGYSTGDLDLNGQVQNSEIQNLLIPNIGRGTQFTY